MGTESTFVKSEITNWPTQITLLSTRITTLTDWNITVAITRGAHEKHPVLKAETRFSKSDCPKPINGLKISFGNPEKHTCTVWKSWSTNRRISSDNIRNQRVGAVWQKVQLKEQSVRVEEQKNGLECQGKHYKKHSVAFEKHAEWRNKHPVMFVVLCVATDVRRCIEGHRHAQFTALTAPLRILETWVIDTWRAEEEWTESGGRVDKGAVGYTDQ